MITVKNENVPESKCHERWIDITTTIEDGMVHWPDDEPVNIKLTSSIKQGANANVTGISMSAHTGTHIDAQRHFVDGGEDITQIPLHALVGEAKVFHILDKTSITLSEIQQKSIEKGDRVIFKTHNSTVDWPMQEFMKDYVYLATDAAQYLREKGVLCVGIDYLSIAGEMNGAEVHRLLLTQKIVIIEGLWLKDVDEGKYDMICLPMKIKGSDGGPARVIIRKRFN